MLTRSRAALAVTTVVLALGTAACGSDDSAGTSGSGSEGTIALLLPESQTTRYESADKPYFEAKVRELCPNCKVSYANANQDEAQQLAQADAALIQGAKVLVLDPVNGATASTIVAKAKAANAKVVSYDRLITGADLDYYISFDNEKVGQLQASALLAKLTADGKATMPKVVMINGSPTDNNAKLFKQGAHSVLDGKANIVRETDTKEWKPVNAQNDMDQTITQLGKGGFDGVYAANDGTAGGAISAMKNAAVSPLPPVTGQDAETAAIQRILVGEQYMTVYKAIKPEAEKAAEIAVALLRNQAVNGASDSVNNGQKDVPSVLLEPVSVTKDNIKGTVIQDGFVKASDLCVGDYAAKCTELGIS